MNTQVDPDTLPPAERNKHFRTKSLEVQAELQRAVADIESNVSTLLKPTQVEYLRQGIRRIAAAADTVCKDEKFNFVCLHAVIEFTLQLCQEAGQNIKTVHMQVQSLKPDSDDYDDAMCLFKKNIAIFASKLTQLEEFIGFGKDVPLDDLWCQAQSSPAWQTVRKFTRYCEFESVEKSIKDYNKKGEIVYHLLAAMGRGAHLIPETNEEADTFLDGAWGVNPQLPIVIRKSKPVDIEKLDDFNSKLVPRLLYYMTHKQKGLTDGSFFVANPEPQIIRMLFNFKDKKTMKFLAAVKAEIKDTDAETDLKYYLNPNMFQDFLTRPVNTEPLGPYKLVVPAGGKLPLSLNHLLHGGLRTRTKLQSIRVRLLFHSELDSLDKTLKNAIASLPDALKDYAGPQSHVQPSLTHLDPKGAPVTRPAINKVQFSANFEAPQGIFLTDEEKKNFDRIFIHVHGGGFVAQSSSTHLGYLNAWTNMFKKPIFSIDYRLADKNVNFPEPLNDVITGYLWILNFLEFVVKVVPKQIVLLGDSAGAALISGLTGWCIHNGVRRADSIFMFYPAINASPFQFSPSLLNSLDDRFLNYSALKMCGLYYVHGAANPSENQYLNLNKMDIQIVSKFPPTEIFIGDRDPLRDESVRFALKLFNAQVKVKLNVLKGLSHALLSNSGNSGMDGANSFVEEVLKSLRKVLSVPLN